MYVKKIVFGILLHVLLKMENISIMDDSVIRCDEIIKSYDKETKAVPTNFIENKATCKTKISIFYLHFFINYYSIINSF